MVHVLIQRTPSFGTSNLQRRELSRRRLLCCSSIAGRPWSQTNQQQRQKKEIRRKLSLIQSKSMKI
jgi:hypothetical protein